MVLFFPVILAFICRTNNRTDVTGQDTSATAESTGNIDFMVEHSKKIGETGKFTISPVNDNRVFATVKLCDVTRNSKSLTIIGHGRDHCTIPVVNAQAETSLFTSPQDHPPGRHRGHLDRLQVGYRGQRRVSNTILYGCSFRDSLN